MTRPIHRAIDVIANVLDQYRSDGSQVTTRELARDIIDRLAEAQVMWVRPDSATPPDRRIDITADMNTGQRVFAAVHNAKGLGDEAIADAVMAQLPAEPAWGVPAPGGLSYVSVDGSTWTHVESVDVNLAGARDVDLARFRQVALYVLMATEAALAERGLLDRVTTPRSVTHVPDVRTYREPS